jgi:hypothetical protein
MEQSQGKQEEQERRADALILIESFHCARLCAMAHFYHAQTLVVGNFPLILNTKKREKNKWFVHKITQ